MHWLPLVAMVIASALPFPHEPAARIVAASLPPAPHHAPDYNSAPTDYNSAPTDYNSASKDYNSQQPTDYNSQQPTDYNSAQRTTTQQPKDYNSAPADYNMAEQRNQRDFITNDDSGVYKPNLANTLDIPPTESTPARTWDTGFDFGRTEKGLEEGLDGLFEGSELLLDAHPRVLFSPSPPEQPPPLLMLEEELDWAEVLAEEHGEGVRREKRSHLTEARWGQRSVCESVHVWVTDKTTAVDTKGNKVSIVQEIQTQSGPIKQYFYETRCRQAEQPQAGRHEETGVDGSSCLGIDKKQWKSKCIAKPSFVRALTKDANNRMGWRWIRIDASCVCVLLSRTNNKAPPGRGRG
ncbi:hypothetical protein WMY93_001896 [Mugilogobius chulae]|uniref:Neurotrophin-4 n=1 Tax=Mugilogobius chulae TaxID=88201 RepID=A0AAW0Q0L1_9GOBI